MKKQQFTNDNANIDLEINSDLTCIANVELTPHCTKAEYEKSLKDLSKKASLPGFRKGRLPRAMMLKNFSKDIERSWHENLSHKALIEVLLAGSIQILQELPTLKPQIKKASTESGATIHLEFEIQPKITEIDVTDIDLEPTKTTPIDEEKVNDMVEHMRLYFAKFEDSEEKELKKEQFVDLDIYNQDAQGSILFKDKRFKMSTKSMAGWMFKALEKAKIGDEIEATSKLDEDANDEMKAVFKPTQLKMVVKAIKKALLPEVTDDFAKKAGVKDLKELLETARKMLEKQAEEKQKEDERTQFIEKLLKKYSFDIPKTMFKKEKEAIIKRWMHPLNEDSNFEKTVVERKTHLEASAARQAEKIVRLHFIVGFVAAKEKVQPSQQEIMQYLTTALPHEEMKKLLNSNQSNHYVNEAILSLTQQKVVHLLIEKIKKK